MPRIKIVLLTVLFLFTCSLAQAQEIPRDDVNICLCTRIMSRMLCKPQSEFNFVDKIYDEATYQFTVFYANKESTFICKVYENEVRIKGTTWRNIMRTVQYSYDPDTFTAYSSYSIPECPGGRFACKATKTPEDLKMGKADDFWNRPIPELLEYELNEGIATGEENGSDYGGDGAEGGIKAGEEGQEGP